MAKITTGTTDGDIKITPNGTGKTVVGTGAADATVQSSGNHNLVLQTGNATTGSITITDGADGNIAITPNGTGEVDISKVDIDGGTIDGTTIATSNITVGAGKALDVSAGTLITSAAQKQAIVDGATITASDVGLGNVTNESKATMFTSPTFTGTITAPNDSISGNAIDGGTISNFASTGIDDNASTTALTIDASENVGIGATSPVSKLEVSNSSAMVTSNAVSYAGAGDGTGFGIYRSAPGRQAGYTWTIENVIANGGAAGTDYQLDDLVFKGRASTTDANLTERMRIDSSGNLKFDSGYGSAATAYGCRAWVNFNGTGTVAIRASGNVSSITDNGTGDYTVNFTTAMPDANYAVNLTSRNTAINTAPVVVNLLTTTTPTASLFRICTDKSGVGAVDPDYLFVSVFR